jgi:hypothetical protein
MQFCRVTVRHKGDMGFEIPNKVVSVPEISVLRYLHGGDAVTNIALCDPPVRRDHEGNKVRGYDFHEHYEYLRSTYGDKVVAACFGEVIHAFPTTLHEIGINPEAEAAAKREQAQRLLQEAEQLSEKPSDEDTSPVPEQADSGDASALL